MIQSELPSKYHDRFEPSRYDVVYSNIQEGDYNHSNTSSPFDVWSVEKLRAKVPPQPIRSALTDVFVWGRGEPKHHAASKVGGIPAWPTSEKLPRGRKFMGLSSYPLRFFGQFNFMDSLELVPELPDGLLSVWGTSDFPWEEGSIHTFWLDPATVSPVSGNVTDLCLKDMRAVPFYASLYRTWDPLPDQEFEPAIVEHQFEAYREYRPRAWDATKIGGVEDMSQEGQELDAGRFFFQFSSIQPPPEVPHPWLNREQPFPLFGGDDCYSNDENSFVLGDMGGISFCLKPNGTVSTLFECG